MFLFEAWTFMREAVQVAPWTWSFRAVMYTLLALPGFAFCPSLMPPLLGAVFWAMTAILNGVSIFAEKPGEALGSRPTSRLCASRPDLTRHSRFPPSYRRQEVDVEVVRYHHRAEEGDRGGRRLSPPSARSSHRSRGSFASSLREEHSGAARLSDLVHAAQHHPVGRGLRPPRRLAQGAAAARRGVLSARGSHSARRWTLPRAPAWHRRSAPSPVGRRPRVPVRQGVRPAAQPQLRRGILPVWRSGVRWLHDVSSVKGSPLAFVPSSCRSTRTLCSTKRAPSTSSSSVSSVTPPPTTSTTPPPRLQRRPRRRDLPRVAHRHGVGTGSPGRRRRRPGTPAPAYGRV